MSTPKILHYDKMHHIFAMLEHNLSTAPQTGSFDQYQFYVQHGIMLCKIWKEMDILDLLSFHTYSNHFGTTTLMVTHTTIVYKAGIHI